MALNKNTLLDRVITAVTESGFQALVTAPEHPFGLRIFKADDAAALKVRVYIWNCTHGGKNRADDEFRVQLTGVVPQIRRGEQTLLLGWHEGYEVFVAFDISRHEGQASASPSIQVKEKILEDAHKKAFSAYERATGEIAIAFRPEFFVEYARLADRLHGQKGAINEYLEALNDIKDLDDDEIADAPEERQEVLVTIRKKVRQQDFRARVLKAYRSECAMCGVQLRLIEAAHILPVAVPESTDETRNGIALCSLHHDAFDRNLVSFNERFAIEVSGAMEASLRAARLIGGLDPFKELLRPSISLPTAVGDRPHPPFIIRSREVRRWRR